MKPETIQKLLALNRTFYSQFAREFSETRPSGQSPLSRTVASIPADARVLDIGCGNGRLAEQLEREGRSVIYVGIDSSRELIVIARSRSASLVHVHAQFEEVDIAAPHWERRVKEMAGFESFDVATALAVLQHIPGAETRLSVLRQIHDLLQPGGLFIMTNWQFLQNEQMRRKIADWRTAGIDPGDIEPGDALLDWKRGGIGYRYSHQLTPAEVEELASASGLQVREQFYAEAELNLYSVCYRA